MTVIRAPCPPSPALSFHAEWEAGSPGSGQGAVPVPLEDLPLKTTT
jgi:hypothetical protein